MIATSEYELLTESAGWVDRSERAKFALRGGEAVDFLQGQVSNDVEALAPGSGCYAAILNHKGKLRTDLRILRGEDSAVARHRGDRPRRARAHAADLHPRARRAVGGREPQPLAGCR